MVFKQFAFVHTNTNTRTMAVSNMNGKLILLAVAVIVLESFVLADDNVRWMCSKDICSKISLSRHRNGWYPTYETQNICRMVCGRHGALWPRPTVYTKIGQNVIQFNPNYMRFDFQMMPQNTKEYVREAARLFIKTVLRECGHHCDLPSETDVLVNIIVKSDNKQLNWETEEKFVLNVTSFAETKVVVQIMADTIYGARHGLETLSQLITVKPGSEHRNGLVLTSEAHITDRPVFRHRGLMLDTSRNFMPFKNIKRTLDGMASCKMNVFHWHITDSHSFPLETPRVPQLSKYGAYSSRMTYKKADVQGLVEYARQRGIRVILEFDNPSHAGNGWQWGREADLGDLAVCVNQQPWRKYCIQPPCGQLNPVNPKLFGVLRNLYKDLIETMAVNETLHMGGDEVHFGCWNSTKEIVDFMTKHNIGRTTKDFLQLWSDFQAASLQIWDQETRNFQPEIDTSKNPVILWTSHLTNPDYIEKYLPKERYIIQPWVPSSSNLTKQLLAKGYKLIISTKDAWYLDHGVWGITKYYNWRRVYLNRLPRVPNVLGGEVCMWGEYIDENGLDSRIWPRAAAAAERLWSDLESGTQLAETRFYRHRERLVNLGLRPEAVIPKWCILNEGKCA